MCIISAFNYLCWFSIVYISFWLCWSVCLCFFSFRFCFGFRFLSVKKWLLRKKHQIELARKRGWKGYWVCLKGTTLLFYPCDSREGRTVDSAPKHLIIVDGAIMQPIPEHPKRDYIFCLSTAFGDAYLFQAPCQVSLIWNTFQSTSISFTLTNKQAKVEAEAEVEAKTNQSKAEQSKRNKKSFRIKLNFQKSSHHQIFAVR